MRREPNIAAVAALIGDPGRAAILTALMDGRALPAGELAAVAGLSPQATSAHLARLRDGGLLALEQEGRHRYHRIAGPGVAAVLEGLAALSTQSARPPRSSVPANPLGFARTCYDHLAGELGVAVGTALQERGLLVPAEGKRLNITSAGRTWLADVLAIDIATLSPGRYGLARRCLDWTERRHHVAGPIGNRILGRCLELALLTKAPGSRMVKLTGSGGKFFRQELGISIY
jgi:DNA-binding transcriptional ArsR family regulator